MERTEALEAISTGHAIYSVEGARSVCAALGVPWDEALVETHESDRHPLGRTMLYGPEQGVWSLLLARHAARALGVKDRAQTFLGRGSQAREYARVVREALAARKP